MYKTIFNNTYNEATTLSHGVHSESSLTLMYFQHLGHLCCLALATPTANLSSPFSPTYKVGLPTILPCSANFSWSSNGCTYTLLTMKSSASWSAGRDRKTEPSGAYIHTSVSKELPIALSTYTCLMKEMDSDCISDYITMGQPITY